MEAFSKGLPSVLFTVNYYYHNLKAIRILASHPSIISSVFMLLSFLLLRNFTCYHIEEIVVIKDVFSVKSCEEKGRFKFRSFLSTHCLQNFKNFK